MMLQNTLTQRKHRSQPSPKASMPTADLSQPNRINIVNLTEKVAIQESEVLLARRAYKTYQHIFHSVAMRQQLIRYALERVNNIYMVLRHKDSAERSSAAATLQRPEIRQTLEEGVQVLTGRYLQQQRQYFDSHQVPFSQHHARLTSATELN